MKKKSIAKGAEGEVPAKGLRARRGVSSSFQENAGDCRLAVLGAMLDLL